MRDAGMSAGAIVAVNFPPAQAKAAAEDARPARQKSANEAESKI